MKSARKGIGEKQAKEVVRAMGTTIEGVDLGVDIDAICMTHGTPIWRCVLLPHRCLIQNRAKPRKAKR